MLGNLFNLNDPLAKTALFGNPNHNSAAVMIDDSTSWLLHPVWRTANNNEWYGQGRQGLLNQVRYDSSDKPTADYPVNVPKTAPKFPSSGIPWMVPHSDFFTSTNMNPEWSFLGYTDASTWSLNEHPGWLTLSPRGRGFNTVIKNDGEHNYSLITRVAFGAKAAGDQAGLWIFNGNQTLFAKLYSSADSAGNKIVAFSYESRFYKVNSPTSGADTTVWLKLVRNEHVLTGYCGSDDSNWVQVGDTINVTDMDGLQPNYNSWTGNRQGLFVQGSPAAFDMYIYRDAYTPIAAETPANQYGTVPSISTSGPSVLDSIDDGDWALYAGVEFGNSDYTKEPDSLFVTASSVGAGGFIEVFLDSLDSGTLIARCNISNTGSWSTFAAFGAKVLVPVSDNHDLYLKFWGNGGAGEIYRLQSIAFKGNPRPTSVRESRKGQLPKRFKLEQNYPNPFNPTTVIGYQLPAVSYVSLRVYDVLGREVATLVNGRQSAGYYNITFDAVNLPSGVYFYKIVAEKFSSVKKLVLVK